MIRVLHNGQVVQENVELPGPTRSAHWEDESPLGPVLLQGDHGPVAYSVVVAAFEVIGLRPHPTRNFPGSVALILR
jgi:hypothetical protein